MSWAFIASATPYNGHVFIDANGNGIRDKGEKPLRGIKVSDGLNVTETGKDGAFELPGHPKERFIFITTPSGFKTNNGYYHRIDPAREEYDFGLIPYDVHISRDGTHRFIHISDTEIFNTSGHDVWTGNLRDYASGNAVAFIVHTGDICYENGLKEHIRLMNTENMGVPVFYGIGNHDLVKGKYGEELFESIYGPGYYSFDVAGTHYIMTPMAGGDHKPGYTTDDVCNWLRNDLAHVKAGTPVIVFNHDLLTNGNDFVYRGKDGNAVNLNDYNLKAWIYGHWHINHMKKQGDVMTICTSSLDKGGIDHATSAYRVVSVASDGSVSSDLRYAYIDRNLCVAAPKGQSSSKTVTVNAYSSTSPVVEVVYSCLDGAKTIIPYRNLTQFTDWTWSGEMPLDKSLSGKTLTLRVRSRFKDGRVEEADSRFVYEPALSAPEFRDDWTNLRGNATHTAKADTLEGKLHLTWTKNVGGNIFMTSPLIYDNKIFTATLDENLKGEAAICALDGQTGDILWKHPVKGSIKNSIAIDRGTVFVQDVYGNLYAVDTSTGALKWSEALPVNGLPALNDGLAAADGVVYAGSGKGLSAFDVATGKLLWRNEDWSQGEGTTTTLTVGNGVVVGGAQWSALYGNDAKNGKKLWSKSADGLRNRGSSPAMHGPMLYLISDKSFFILDARSGEVIVRKQLPYNLDATSTPLLTDGEIIFGTADKGLVALDRQTLEQKWNTVFDNALVFTVPYSSPFSAPFSSTVETSPVLAGNVVYVGASDGTVYAIDPATGKKLWRHELGAPVFSSPAISGNTLVVTDFGGNVSAFVAE